ncbi:hypothetical protein H5159_00825 [Pseudoalteromonas sp. SG43-1]|uniref:hypothetical protein n=1 Tax=Pseudoalteromonas sp. SG43-1 TaxID=2760971 RepID=UPI0015FFE961|nr:hypothetical protein [Pseudoalteromonas sp. SG43-1]MBB1449631.1 hypothetical protein [Pseudoalteromonas sp. SG43-1]
MNVIKEIQLDLKVNKGNGFFTKLIFITYRLGKACPYRILRIFITVFHKLFCLIVGCSIPYGCDIGSSVCFKHGFFGVFISKGARIGNGCIILHHVTIGSQYLDGMSAPTLREQVQVGAGAVIIGDIEVASLTKVSPNAFLNKSTKVNSKVFAVSQEK